MTTTLITGASSGLGHELALRLGARGENVALVARRAERLEELAAAVDALGGRALALPLDVRDGAAVVDAVARTVESFGSIDRLVAGAGVSAVGPAHRQSIADVERVLDINLRGTLHAVHAVLPAMVERRSGHLVAVGSLSGYRGLPGAAAYSASKAALLVYFEALRIELRRRGIAVTTICPGFVATEMTADVKVPMPQLLTVEAAVDRMLRAIDRRRGEVAFPIPLAWLVRWSRHLPNFLYDRLAAGLSRTGGPPRETAP